MVPLKYWKMLFQTKGEQAEGSQVLWQFYLLLKLGLTCKCWSLNTVSPSTPNSQPLLGSIDSFYLKFKSVFFYFSNCSQILFNSLLYFFLQTSIYFPFGNISNTAVHLVTTLYQYFIFLFLPCIHY